MPTLASFCLYTNDELQELKIQVCLSIKVSHSELREKETNEDRELDLEHARDK